MAGTALKESVLLSPKACRNIYVLVLVTFTLLNSCVVCQQNQNSAPPTNNVKEDKPQLNQHENFKQEHFEQQNYRDNVNVNSDKDKRAASQQAMHEEKHPHQSDTNQKELVKETNQQNQELHPSAGLYEKHKEEAVVQYEIHLQKLKEYEEQRQQKELLLQQHQELLRQKQQEQIERQQYEELRRQDQERLQQKQQEDLLRQQQHEQTQKQEAVLRQQLHQEQHQHDEEFLHEKQQEDLLRQQQREQLQKQQEWYRQQEELLKQPPVDEKLASEENFKQTQQVNIQGEKQGGGEKAAMIEGSENLKFSSEQSTLEKDLDDTHKEKSESTKGDENAENKATPEEIEAESLYQAGEKLINSTYYKEYKEAFLYFLKAAELGHAQAKEYLAFGLLFGDYVPQNVTKASEIFKELADQGSPKAQMGLAFMYSSGFYFNSSQAKALIFLTFGALGGNAYAQMALGYRYYAGIGVESKCETALTYYRKVATKVAGVVTFAGGPVVQRIRLQEEAESQGNNSPLLDDDLLQYYHFLADKGDQQAQIVLGTLYYQGGKGVQINHEQAFHYFSTAAESGNAHALGYLGKMHSEGSPFVKQSNQTALEYFKLSSDKNNHIGQAGLGMMYLKGLGVEKDTNKAFRFFSLASDQGSVDGQLQLGIMYFTGNGIRKDYKMAVKYFTLASQNGHVLAYFNLAQMHATGTGVMRNCHTAVELFKNVAERGRWSEMLMDAHRMYQNGNLETAIIKYMFLAELGYEVAQSNVAYILDNGIVSKFEKHETYQRALLQYSRAAVQGSTHARLKIGDYYYYGCGTDVDYESAASHYRIASEQQRNPQAMFNLGYMHERGLGMKQDVHLAKRFYDMAAETSIDAHIPVTLALLKLGLFYGVDVFSKEFEGLSALFQAMDPELYFGTMWDIYLASFLALAFTLLYFLRRMR